MTLHKNIKIDQHGHHIEPGCSGKTLNSFSTSGTHRATLEMSHDCKNDGIVIMTKGIYPWLFLTLIFHNSLLADVRMMTDKTIHFMIDNTQSIYYLQI